MRNLTRMLTTAAAATLIATLGGFATAPAHAATPTCNTSAFKYTNPSRHIVDVPVRSSDLSTTCLLKRGNKGQGVSILQYTMREIYGYNIAVDGDFGGATERALLSLQRELRIKADGIYGPQTRDKICWNLPFWTDGSACAWLNY